MGSRRTTAPRAWLAWWWAQRRRRRRAAVTPTPPATPTLPAGLTPVAWWHAADLLLAQNAPVLSWPDRVAAYPLTPPSEPAAPTFEAWGVGGQPGAGFGPGTDLQTTSALLGLTPPLTVVVVARLDETGGFAMVCWDNALVLALNAYGTQTFYLDTFYTPSWTAPGAWPAGVPVALGAVVASETLDGTVNGVSQPWVGGGTVGAGCALQEVHLSEPSMPLGGVVAEVLVFAHALSGAEQAALQSYFNSQYNA